MTHGDRLRDVPTLVDLVNILEADPATVEVVGLGLDEGSVH